MSFYRYNPHLLSCEEIIKQFVVRRGELETLLKHCDDFRTGLSNRPVLVSGTRGSGKTTLLRRLSCEPNFFHGMKVCRLPEEQYDIRNLYALWNVVFREVTGQSPERPSSGGLGVREEKAFEGLRAPLASANLKCVIIIENIEDLIKRLTPLEIEILIKRVEEKWILLICGSSRLLQESIDLIKFPVDFFSVFQTMQLESLTLPEVKILAENLIKDTSLAGVRRTIDSNPGKFEALLRLTGGIPRTVMVAITVFQAMASDSAEKYLGEILDGHSPLYKNLLDDLQPDEQVIVHALATQWDAIPIQEIVDATDLSKEDAYTALIKLEHSNMVERQTISEYTSDAKESLYYLKERFLNMWYLMRSSADPEDRMRFLVRFLEVWCSAKIFEGEAEPSSIMHLGLDTSVPILDVIINAIIVLRRTDASICNEVNYQIRECLINNHVSQDKTLLTERERRLFEEGDKFFRNNDIYQCNLCLIQIDTPCLDVIYRLAVGFYLSDNAGLASKYFRRAYDLDLKSETPRYTILTQVLNRMCSDAESYTRSRAKKVCITGEQILESSFIGNIENDPGSTFYLGLMMDVEDHEQRVQLMTAAKRNGCFPILTSIACLLFRNATEKKVALEFARSALAIMALPLKTSTAEEYKFTNYKEDIIVRKFASHVCALTLLWNGNAEDAVNMAVGTLSHDDFLDAFYYNAIEYNSIGAPMFLYLLLASPYAHLARELFSALPRLSIRFYHIYCAAARILGSHSLVKGRGVQEGWGGKDTVDEITARIARIKRVYFPNSTI